MSKRTVFKESVNEQIDVAYSGTIKDKADNLIDQANIATMFVTIYLLRDSATIIRVKQDVRNGGSWDKGVKVLTGIVTIALYPTDTVVQNDTPRNKDERLIILIEGTTAGSPSFAFKHEIDYGVKNLDLVT